MFDSAGCVPTHLASRRGPCFCLLVHTPPCRAVGLDDSFREQLSKAGCSDASSLTTGLHICPSLLGVQRPCSPVSLVCLSSSIGQAKWVLSQINCLPSGRLRCGRDLEDEGKGLHRSVERASRQTQLQSPRGLQEARRCQCGEP